MKRILRFISGLGVFLSILVFGGILLAFLAPLIIGSSILLMVGLMGLGILISIVSFFTMVWHLSKKEQQMKTKDFKISQSKQAE
jgi:hypothetical protein